MYISLCFLYNLRQCLSLVKIFTCTIVKSQEWPSENEQAILGRCSIFLSGHPRLRDTLLMLWSFFPLYSMLRLPAESLALSQRETGLSFSVEQRVPLLCYTIYHELFINHLTCISWNRNTHSRTIAKVFKCCIYLVVWWSSPRWNYRYSFSKLLSPKIWNLQTWLRCQ